MTEYDNLDLPSFHDYTEGVVPPDEESHVLGSLKYSPNTRKAVYKNMCAKLGKQVLVFKERHVFSSVVTTIDIAHMPMQSVLPKLSFVGDVLSPLLGPKSIFFKWGDGGKRDRTRLNKAFGHADLERMLPEMLSASMRLRDTLLKAEEFAPKDHMNRVTCEIMSQAGFGYDLSKDPEAAYHVAHLVPAVFNPLAFVPIIGTQLALLYERKTLQSVQQIIDQAIELHSKASASTEFPQSASLLMHLFDVAKEEGVGGNLWLRDNLQLFMVASTDTTSFVLAWLCYILAWRRDIQAKVLCEIDEHVTSDQPTQKELQSLKFLDCTIKEALRVYPSIPLNARELSEDDLVDGRRYANGTLMFFDYTLVHNRDDLFPRADEFSPERWLDDNVRSEALCTFSSGSRSCIGRFFAMLQMKAILVTLLRQHSLECAKSGQSFPVCKNNFGMLAVKEELVLKLVPRC